MSPDAYPAGGPGDPDAAEFWAEQARRVGWIRRPAPGDGPWFEGGTLNLCYNALDRHVVLGHADAEALVHTDGTGATTVLTYAVLLERVAELAGALRGIGATDGDAVVLALPLLPDLVVARLACLRLGAVPVVLPVGPGDASGTPEGRDGWAGLLDELRPPVVLAASAGPADPTGAPAPADRVRAALEVSGHRPEAVVVRQRPGATPVPLAEPRDLDWGLAARLGRTAPAECAAVAAGRPAVLVPAGPGADTAVVRPTGGLAVALAWAGRVACGLGPGDRWSDPAGAGAPGGADASSYPRPPDVATAAGQAILLDLPLLAGATAVLSEGPAGTAVRLPEGVVALVAGEDPTAPGACVPATG